MSAHNHAEHVAGCFRCELSREEAMTARECHHDTTTHDYDMALPASRTLRIDRVCDRCDKTLQTFWGNAEEADQ